MFKKSTFNGLPRPSRFYLTKNAQNIHKNVAEDSLHIVKFWLIPNWSNKMNTIAICSRLKTWCRLSLSVDKSTWFPAGKKSIQKVRENVVGAHKWSNKSENMESTWFRSKNSWNCCGWFIHHQKWSYETNSRFKKTEKEAQKIVKILWVYIFITVKFTLMNGRTRWIAD